MVNWKASNYTAGVFSVLVFIITTILFIMYLVKTPEGKTAISSTKASIATKAQSIADKLSDNGTKEETSDTVKPSIQSNIEGGGLSNPTIFAVVLEVCALCFSAIIWGITFGQATTGY